MRQSVRKPSGAHRRGLAAVAQVAVRARWIEGLEARLFLAGDDPYISEFLASNNTGVADNYGQRSDWIEIHNPGLASVDLAGWSLTDDPALPKQWVFPTTPLAGGSRLIVWASSRGDAVSGQPLHVNFNLKASGEYLAMLKPDGLTKASEFDPFPPQVADVSYGVVPGTPVTLTFVGSGAEGRYTVPSATLPGWTSLGFADGGWTTGLQGIGYQGSGQTAPLPAEDEPNGTTATANDARRNFAALSGNLFHQTITGNAGSSVDYYNIGAMQAGDILTLTASGTGSGRNTAQNLKLDLYRLGGGSGTLVTSDSDSGPGNDALIHRLAITTADTYYAVVSREVVTNSLDYNLNLLLENTGTAPTTGTGFAVESESNNNVSSADNASASWRAVNYRSSTDGAIATGTDVDVYQVTLSAGDVLSLNVDSLSALDARVSLLSSAGAVLAIEDGTSTLASPYDLDSFIHAYRITTAGTYYIEVKSVGTTSGAYRLESLLYTATAPPTPVSFAPYIGSNVASTMRNVNASLYERIPFVAGDVGLLSSLTLRVRYDDGFAAYLNDTLVATRNAPGTLSYNSAATTSRSDASAIVFEDIDLTAYRNLLINGDNVLAIQALNASAADSDLLIQAELTGSATPPGAVTYMATPTHGTANVGGALGIVADTNFSIDRGFFTAPISVAITSATSGAEIRYTLDGRAPTAGSTLYTGPLTISTTTTLRAAAFKAGYIASNADTQTYIFPLDVIQQPTLPAGFPATWINRNNTVAPGLGSDYAMDPEVVNNPAYAGEIVDDLLSIPTLSLVMNVDDWFGNGSTGTNGIQGIYTNPESKDADGAVTQVWERRVSAELIYPDGSDGFQINAGVQIQGGASRAPGNSPKHALRLLFKEEYGAGKLNFPWFGDDAASSFDAIVLKAGYNNSWIHHNNIATPVGGQRERTLFVHDQFSSDTQLAMGGLSKHTTYVHLYINGLYWGIYSPMERPEASFGESYLGGDEADYDAITSLDDGTYAPTAIDGDLLAWNAMFAVAARPGGDPRHISTAAGYADIAAYLDLPAFADYMLLNFYLGNNDWDQHNWYAIRRSRVDGVPSNVDGFKFVSFDAERVLESTTENKIGTNNANKPSALFQALRQNPEFRLLFADRVRKHFFNDGALSPTQVKARLEGLLAQVESAAVAESARWGDYRRDNHPSGTPTPIPLYTRDVEWQAEKQRVLSQYTPIRTANVLAHLRSAGLYPQAVDAVDFAQMGGSVPAGYALVLTQPTDGVIYYTLDETDPRVSGGGVSATALLYGGAVTLTASGTVRARVFHAASNTWSALTEATFAVGPAPTLGISEVMYNPAPLAGSGFTGRDFEFIEVLNTGSEPVELSGIRLQGVASFVFPAGTLAPGARTVVVSNLAAFQLRYGTGIAVAGVYSGNLSGNGERLTLRTATGQQIQSFRYQDDWYSLTDGDGFSLVAVDPTASDAALSDKEAWRVSNVLHGAPGAADPGYNNNAIVINEVLSNPAVPGTGWIELRNTTAEPIDVGGWFISDLATSPAKFQIAPNSVIPDGGYLVLSEPADFGATLALNPLGQKLYLRSNDGAGNPGGYRDVVDFGAADTGVSFGRHIKSTGGSDFAAMAALSPNNPNGAPRVGPVVISEIMYAPDNGGDEYIEIANISAETVPLHDGANGWALTDGVAFAFGPGTSLAPGEYALIVAMDPAAFRSKYSISPSVQIFGPFIGVLRDKGENLELSKPTAASPGTAQYISIDRVNYEDGGAWSAQAFRNGPSLQRLMPLYANDAANWKPAAAGGTPGAPNAFSQVPIVDLGADAIITEGTTLNIAGAFSDADSAESWTATIDFGDGTTRQVLTLNANKTFSVNRIYTDNGTYVITVRVTDSRGLVGQDQRVVNVTNVAPTLTFIPLSVNEAASSATLVTGSRTDPSSIDTSAGFRMSYDFGDNGTFEALGVTSTAWSVPAAYLADSGTVPVRVRILDKDGKWADYTTSITVNNLAPTAILSNVAAVNEGSPGSVAFVSQNDASAADRAAGYTYSYDFDNDGAFEIASSASGIATVPASYLTQGPGSRVVRARIIDKDGGFTDYTTSITINNVAPAIDALADAVVGIGWPLNVAGAFADPGDDTWSLSVDFGDGADFEPQAASPGRTFSFSHAWTTPGTRTVTVRVSDGEAQAERSFSVNVRGPALANTGGIDVHTLRLTSDGTGIEVFENTPTTLGPTFTLARALVTDVTFNGAGGSDQVIIDYANGAVLPGKLHITGGMVSVSKLNAGNENLDLAASGSAQVSLAGTTRLGALSLSDASHFVVLGTPLLDVQTIDLAAGATLDLASASLIVRATPATRAAVLAQLTSAIAAARNGGLWDLPGLTSNAIAGAPRTTLGIILNESASGAGPLHQTYGGSAVDINCVLVRHVADGDANLDGLIDIDDYFQIDIGYARALTGFAAGDFNYSGAVSADDYFLIDAAFINPPGPLAAGFLPVLQGDDESTLDLGESLATVL